MNKTILSGRYEIENKIGAGGMSDVYKATDLKLNRTVAIKVLKEEYRNNEQKINIFSHETDVMSRINHDNCVKIYSRAIDEIGYYIVMEYVDGCTLKDLIQKEGKLSPTKAVKYALQILAALDEAHKKDIIHRDIKPQNILVDKNGNVKVADFGIARLLDGQSGTITDTNFVLGSVHYVSPEQASASNVDARSDLYSVGIVLYEMLTGDVPFKAENAMQVAIMQCEDTPASMRMKSKFVPVSLDEVVMKALKKNPEDRYESAEDMAKDLKRALKQPGGGIVASKSVLQRVYWYIKQNGQNTMLIVLSAVTILILLIYGYGRLSDAAFGVDVPDVIGLSYDEAAEVIHGKEMSMQRVDVYEGSAAKGTVIRQTPEGSTRSRKNMQVTVTVDLGVMPVELPDTVGSDKASALSLLSSYGFTEVSIVYDHTNAKPFETVLAQNPNGGTAEPNREIVLTVNSDDQPLPLLCGKSQRQALDILESMALNAEIITGYAPDENPDTVILQYPQPDTKLIKGSTVRLVLATELEKTYYYDYNLFVPLEMDVVLVLTTPSGSKITAYEAVTKADTVLDLMLTSRESGLHTMDVYFNSELIKTEMLDFE